MVSHERLLETLEADVARLAAIPDDQLSAPVAACPGWSVTDLLAHLGRVHHRALGLLDGAPFVPLDAWEATPVGEAAVAWSRAVAGELVAKARQVDPEAPTHNWLGDAPASFWIRRMAQETSVHCWDAEIAIGDPTPIAPDIGADGVDELLTFFVPRLPADHWAAVLADDVGGASAATRSIHLHATDTAGEWMITVGPDGVSVTAEHGKGDVAVRAGGAELNLLVWNRITLDADDVECFGDQTIIDRFLAAAHF